MDMHPDILSISFPAETIRTRVAGLGLELFEEYHDKRPIFLCVLKGAYIFCADLIRSCGFPIEVEFIRASSYGSGAESSGSVRIDGTIPEIKGRHVLIVEDILDTGTTLSRIIGELKGLGPASLKVCAFLDKPGRRLASVDCDYTGFTCDNSFFVGYGLDYNEHYRNLPDIGILDPAIYKS